MLRRGFWVRPVLNVPQKRVRTDRLGTTVDGDEWDLLRSSNVYREPIGNAVMLLPAPRSTTWNTTGSGDYARLRKTDYTLTSAKWREESVDFVGDYYVSGADPSGNPGEAVVTVASQPENGGMYIRWFAANSSAQDWVQLECGYGANPTAPETHPVSFRIYASGKVEVWRFNVEIGQVQISGNETTQQTANTFTDLLIIPGYRRREVLILSNRGGGGSVLFDDVAESEEAPVVVPSSPFWWTVPTGLAKVQCAPIKYPASGFVVGISSYFREPVASDADLGYEFVSHDANGGSVDARFVENDSVSTTFVPDDVKRTARVRVDIAGTGYLSPIVYGAYIEFENVLANTHDSRVDMSQVTTRMSLRLSDSPSDSRVELEFHSPYSLEVGSANLQPPLLEGGHGINTSNEPFALELNLLQLDSNGEPNHELGLGDTLTVFEGRTEPAQRVWANSDRASRYVFEARDGWKALEGYRFTERVPLDGMDLKQAFEYLLDAAGFDEDYVQVDEALADFELPNISSSDWSTVVEIGDTAADWVKRLHENYCATWFMGFKPTGNMGWEMPQFKFVLIDDNPRDIASPDAELWCGIDEWMDTAGDPPEPPEDEAPPEEWEAYAEALEAYNDAVAKMRREIPARVFRDFSAERLECESNDIWVTGFDHAVQRPIQAHKADLDSQAVGTPADLRPTNWLGEIRKYGLYDPSITTQDALERAVNILYDRLTPRRTMVEFTCDFLVKENGVPIWRGDVVKLHVKSTNDSGATLTEPKLYRIKSLAVEFVREPKAGKLEWHPARYVAEEMQVADAELGLYRDTSASLAGTSLREVVDAHRLRVASGNTYRKGSEHLATRNPFVVYEVA